MKNGNNRTTADAAKLRRRAEKVAQSTETPETISSAETRQRLHELHVHQIELEMQNAELRRVQVELDAARTRYFDLYDMAPMGYCTISEKGLVLEANLTATTLLGVARNAIVGQPIVRFVFEEDRDIYYLHSRHLFSTGEPQKCELRMAKTDGTVFWAHMTAAAARNTDGSFVCRVVVNDITERKNAEEALRFSEAHLHALVESIPDLVWLKNREGVYLSCNPTFERFFGAKEAEIVGKTDYDFVDKDLADSFREHDRKAMDADAPSINEEWLTFAENGYRGLFETIKTPMRDAEGVLIGVTGIARDITGRKQVEDELRRYRDNLEELVTARTVELEAANSGLEAFSYSVSHDLKAPLRAVDGFARILEEDYANSLDDEGRRLLKVIRKNTQDMKQLIDGLLSFSRMSRKELAMSHLDMAGLVRAIWGQIISLHKGRHIELHVAPLPAAYGDTATICEVLTNLLSNAVKFTVLREHAVVEVTGQEKDDKVIYSVRDNGVGFDMTQSNRLFNVFQRLHDTSTFEGTGIGLALVKRIVQKHGGRVWAEGEEDTGATFSFSLPKERKKK